jgi:Tfp pilus assembly protein PilV
MRQFRSQDGFSLVESLVACAVLGTALLSAGHLASSAIALTNDARHRTVATLLAIAKFEELRSSGVEVDGSEVVDSAGRPPSPGSSRRYQRRWMMTRVSADADIVTVVVSAWPADSARREVRLTGAWARR